MDKQIEPKIIRSEAELREMLNNFLPGSEAHVRKVLMENFETIKAKVETREKIEEVDPDEYGGFVPAPLVVSDALVTLDNFIVRSMGGERVGLTIQWVVGGVTWVFDPWTGELRNE
jgi:hypothetical protein